MIFLDVNHDPDSCLDVWNGLYKKVYQDLLDDIFDFSVLNDSETSPKCKRWYIKYKKESEFRKKYPKFKVAGDCIFNFNSVKKEKYIKILGGDKEPLLDKCCERHHSFENMALLPITGALNNQKQGGRFGLDRPDKHLLEINKLFDKDGYDILKYCRSEESKKAVIDYFNLFYDFENYFKIIFFFGENDETAVKWLNKLIEFWKTYPTIDCKDVAKKYMVMANEFWDIRKEAINNRISSKS